MTSTKRCASFTFIPAPPPTSSPSGASPKPRRFEDFSRRPRRSVLTRPARSHTQDDFFAAGKKSPRLKRVLGVTALSGTRAAANPVQRLAKFLRLGSDVPAFLTTIRVSRLMVPHFSANWGFGGASVLLAIFASPSRRKTAGETPAPPTRAPCTKLA